MLYFTIVNWILISLFGILYFITTIMPLIVVKDNVKNVYLFILSCLLATIIFMSLKDVVSIKASIITWKVLVAIPWAFSIVIFFYKGRSPHKYIIFVLNTMLGSMPFLINAKLDIPSHELDLSYFINNYTLDSLMSMVSVVCLLMTALLVVLMVFRNNSIKSQIDQGFREQKALSQQLHANSYQGISNQINAVIFNQKRQQSNSNVTPELINTLSSLIINLPKITQLVQAKSDKHSPIIKIESSQIIRDINHTIATPLSQIKVNSELIRSKEKPSEMKVYAGRISRQAEICSCVIQGYRDLVANPDDTSTINLNQQLLNAFEIYRHNYNKSLLKFDLHIDDSILNYSPAIIISILTPLLENAVSAASEGSSVSIKGSVSKEGYLVSVKNKCDQVPNNSDLDKAGFSTKPNHNGIGLEAVRTLLTLCNGTLSHSINGNIVEFWVELKGKKYE